MGRNQIQKCKIIYFSGTGGTAMIAKLLSMKLKDYNIQIIQEAIDQSISLEEKGVLQDEYDLLIILYAVHAFDAPEPVYDWIKCIPSVTGTPVVLLPVSAGGEVWMNSSCRIGCVKRLTAKGYEVIYEDMLIMPSNFLVATERELALRVLQLIPVKIGQIISEISSGVHKRIKPKFGSQLMTILSKLEKLGAKFFGKSLKISNTCTSCGWCAKKCPVGNINLQNSKPVFGWRCIVCLRCVYGCPQKAIYSNIFSFIIIKEGYNLDDLTKQVAEVEFESVETLQVSYTCKGIYEYLVSIENYNNAR